MATPHLMSLGARLLPRNEFVALLASHASLEPSRQRWGHAPAIEPEHRLTT
jgi:Leu/Phe-tRNA-protein transferase